jgi:DNA gyrase subunit A
MAIRFAESDARAMGRNTKGVKGINLMENDEVVGMVVADPEGFLLTVCENGYGKRTPFGANTAGEEAPETEAEEPVEETPPPSAEEGTAEDEGPKDKSGMRYRKQRRGGKGLRDIRTSERNGPVIGISPVRETDDIMLITTGGMVNRTHVREIRVIGRNTQGVRIMNLNEGDKIASIAKVAQEEEEGDSAETAVGEQPPTAPESPDATTQEAGDS